MEFENQAIPAIIFILVLMTVAMWIISMCRDGYYHCDTKRRSPFMQKKPSPRENVIATPPVITRYTATEPVINSYTSSDIYQRRPVYDEDFSSSDSSRQSTPDRSTTATPRSKPAPYVKNDKCTRSGRKY